MTMMRRKPRTTIVSLTITVYYSASFLSRILWDIYSRRRYSCASKPFIRVCFCVILSVCLHVCLFVCPHDNSKTNAPKMFKLGIGNDLGIAYRGDAFRVERSKVKVTGYKVQKHIEGDRVAGVS